MCASSQIFRLLIHNCLICRPQVLEEASPFLYMTVIKNDALYESFTGKTQRSATLTKGPNGFGLSFGGKPDPSKKGRSISNDCDLGRAPYVLYGVNYIGLVPLQTTRARQSQILTDLLLFVL